MKQTYNKILAKLDDAIFLRKFNGWLTIVWFVMIPVTMLTPIKDSVAYISFLSITALFLSSLSSWAASRAEVKIDEQTNTAKVK